MSGCLPAQKAGKLCLEMMLSMRRPALTTLPPKPGILVPGAPKVQILFALFSALPGISRACVAHLISLLTQRPRGFAFTERDEFANRGKLVGNWHTHFGPSAMPGS